MQNHLQNVICRSVAATLAERTPIFNEPPYAPQSLIHIFINVVITINKTNQNFASLQSSISSVDKPPFS